MKLDKDSTETNADEINIVSLFGLFRSIFRGITNKFSYGIFIVEKYVLLIGFVTCIGIGFALINYFVTPRVYTSHAIITSNSLNNEFCEDIINDLYYLSKESNYEILSTKLNMPVKECEKIKRIEFKPFETDKKDTTLEASFKIEVQIYDNSVLDTLQDRLIHYLEFNPYAVKKKVARIEVLNDLTKELDHQILGMDSLKKNMTHGLMVRKREMDGSEGWQYIDPMEAYMKIIKLKEKKLGLTEDLRVLSNFDLIKGFTKYSKQSSPRLFKDTAIYALVMFVIGFILALRKEKKSLIAKIPSSPKETLKEVY